MSGFNFREETRKCVFKNCPNTAAFQPKSDLFFVMFNSLPPSIREEWIRIVARERGEPAFEPHVNSMMCSEHFTPNERSKLCQIKMRKSLAERALIPTVNIGPYNDTILIKDDDVRDCSQGDDYVCIIENQIRTDEPEPQVTNEKEIDIEDQIQFSLVEKTKHFEGLIQRIEPKTTQICHTYNVQNNDDEDVVIIEDDKEIKNSENEYLDQFSQFVKKRDEDLKRKQRKYYKPPLSLTYETILSNSKQLPETKGPQSSNLTLQELLTRSPPPPTTPLSLTMSQAGPCHVVEPHNLPTPQYVTKPGNVTKSQVTLIIKEENDDDDDVIIVAEDIEFDVSEDEVEKEYSEQYSQFLKKLNAGTVTKKKNWNSVEPKRTVSHKSKKETNSKVTSTQPIAPTSLATLQNLTTAPLFMASPMLTAQNGTVKQLIPITPMIATNVGQQVAAPQLVALIPSNGVQQTLYLQDNNLQTYFLSPVVSTTPQLVIESGQVVIKQEENKR